MTYLFVLQVVAYAPITGLKYEWENLGGFSYAKYCHVAAKQLAIDPKLYRCISKTTGETE